METPIKKDDHIDIEIIDIGINGEGIGKIADYILFIPNAVPGDYAQVQVIKTKRSFGYGKVIKIITPSPFRVTPTCAVAHYCGGCQLQHIDYNKQLSWKTQKVKETLRRIGGLTDVVVEETLGMADPYHYRNKAQYPIRKQNGEVMIGFFSAKSHQINEMPNCVIQDSRNEGIIKRVKDFLIKYNISIYNEETHKGLVRHLLIKTAYDAPEMMVCLVINGSASTIGTILPHQEELIASLREVEAVTSIALNQNTERTSTVLGINTTVIYGKDHIIDTIGELKFKISPLSFFQVNPLQTKVLYDKVLEFAALTGTETVWDAYCGIGTITLHLAQSAKRVYGVELIPEAIDNANANAELNHITNTKFYTGRAEEIIPNKYKEGIIADTIVVDPPRKGCDVKLLETLIEMQPNKIIYVSCDAATLARDLAYLTRNGYLVDKVQPVDMFPQTTHVETVVKLTK